MTRTDNLAPRHIRHIENNLSNNHSTKPIDLDILVQVFANSPDAICIHSSDGRMLYANAAAEKLVDLKNHEIVGRYTWELPGLSEEESARLQEFYFEVLSGSTERAAEFRFQIPDVGVKTISAKVFSLETPGERVFVSVSRDVTEQKATEATLRNSEERYRGLVESQKEMIIRVDNQGVFTFVNDAYCKKYGLKPEEIVGQKSYKPWVHPDDLKATLEIMKGLEHPPYRITVQQRTFTVEGMRWIEWEDYAIRDEEGKIIEIQAVGRDIHDRKLAEANLREAQQRVELAFLGSELGLWDWEAHSNLVTINDRWAAMLGYAKSELSPLKYDEWIDMVHPDDRANLISACDQYLQEQVGLYESEYRLRKKNGKWLWVLARGKAVEWGTDGKITRIAGTHMDITERKLMQDALAESERKFRGLYESVPDGIVLFDLDGRILECNSAYQAMLGYSEAELCCMSDADVTPTKWHEREQELMNGQVRVRGYSDLYEKEYVRKDGRVLPIAIRCAQIHDSVDQTPYIWAVVRDMSEMKKAESDLRLLAAAVEQSVNSLAILDEAGLVQYVNPAFEKLTGYSLAEVRKLPFIDLACHSENFKSQYSEIQNRLKLGLSWVGKSVSIRKGGQSFEEEISITAVRDQAGTICNHVVVKRDITKQSSLEHQLRQSQKLEAIGRLAGGIAHDFNNLLTVITGYGDSLYQKLRGDELLSADLLEICKAAERATSLTRQLLAFSRQQVVQPRIVNINTVVSEMSRLLTRVIGEDVSLELKLNPELDKVIIDPGQIEQILLNLVVNARDAMPAGGSLTISTRNLLHSELDITTAPDKGRRVELSITDTGFGMSEEIIKHIFEPFFTTKEIGKGTGLGLSTVYGIIQQNGGTVDVVSSPGLGSTFKICLPALTAEEVSEELKPEVRVHVKATETILLVEDDPTVRNLTKRILQGLGYSVLVAADGIEAMSVVTTEKSFDLLLTDMVMPGISGLELSNQVALLRPAVGILLMTGYSRENLDIKDDMGAYRDVITKPFTQNELAQKVRVVLDAVKRLKSRPAIQ